MNRKYRAFINKTKRHIRKLGFTRSDTTPMFLGIICGMAFAMLLQEPAQIKVITLPPTDCIQPTPTLLPTHSPTPTPRIKAVSSPTRSTSSGVWVGKVSHYSRSGCLGCSASLTMANGQPLDDTAMTIAFNQLPMNTRVKITNLDNGKSVEATVTDTGGFERLGRIADFVPAVANALETKTDRSQVKIEAL